MTDSDAGRSRGTNKKNQTFEVEADSLEEASTLVESRIPEGMQLISEKVVSDGKPKSVVGISETVEAAFQQASSRLPVSATVLERKILITSESVAVLINSFDEGDAKTSATCKVQELALKKLYAVVGERKYRALAKSQMDGLARVGGIEVKKQGSKGFLGIGKKPNLYEVQVEQQAVVAINYRQRPIIRATVARFRFKCNSCGAFQKDGAWEKAMDTRAKAMGRKGFINLSASPECLKCGSTDMIDLTNPPTEKEKEQKGIVLSLPERAQIVNLLKEWESLDQRSHRDLERYGSTPETRMRHASALNRKQQIERRITTIGKKLAKDGGHGLMYQVCTSLDRRRWQDIVSSCWDGIAGWMH